MSVMGWVRPVLGQAAKLPVWEMCLPCSLCAKHLRKDAGRVSKSFLAWSRISHPFCQHPLGGAGIPEDLWHISLAKLPSRAQPVPVPGFWVAVRALWERQLCCKCLFLGTPGSLTFGDKRITASHRLNSTAALRPHMAG